MINKIHLVDDDKVLVSLLESNDKTISGGRAKMTITKKNNQLFIEVNAKDKSAFRAMNKSIENTTKILTKVRSVI